MTVDYANIIELLVTFVTGGGITAFFYIRQERRSRDLDNKGKEKDVDSKVISNAKEVVAEYKELLEHYKSEFEIAHAKVDELSNEIHEMKKQMAIMQTELQNSHLLYATANALKCSKIKCQQRKPMIDKKVLEEVAGIDIDDTTTEDE